MNSTSDPRWPPEGRHVTTRVATARVPGRRTYYDHHGVHVTDQVMDIVGRRFTLAYLSDLRAARGPLDPVATFASVIAGVMMLLALAVAISVDDMALTAVLLPAGLVPAALAAVTCRLRPRMLELWADYRGAEVQLYWSFDEQTFNQVCRALVRAREAQPVSGLR